MSEHITQMLAESGQVVELVTRGYIFKQITKLILDCPLIRARVWSNEEWAEHVRTGS